MMSPKVPMTERSESLPSVNVHQMMGPATPMTPMTPASADPGILPQLQYVCNQITVTFPYLFFSFVFFVETSYRR